MRPLIVIALFALSLMGRAQDVRYSEAARDSLVHGVQAFKAGQYQDAVRDFQAAVDAEPDWHVARLYLATALSYQVVPNLDSPENLAIANRALDQFNLILTSNPEELDALRQVASIQRNVRRFDEALATERKIIAIDPKDAEAHYTIGVIEWTEAYKFAVQTLSDESLEDDGNGNVRLSTTGCAAMVSHNGPLVNDAISELTRAVESRPNYDDAMQYLNLAYRRKADFACGNAEQRNQDLATANEWIRRAVEARKANERQREQQVANPPMK